jgi:hypothetical protein
MSDAEEAVDNNASDIHGLSPIDHDALVRCVAALKASAPDWPAFIDALVAQNGWLDTARFCSYSCQSDSLHLKPWQSPPAWGRSSDAAELVDRLIAAKLSIFEPDPLSALAQAAAKPKPRTDKLVTTRRTSAQPKRRR